MKLSPHACEYYRLRIDSTPSVSSSAWELSVDGGETWHTGAVVEGLPAWLVCGPDYDGPEPAITVSSTLSRPLIRLIDNPETIVRRTPKIVLVTPGPIG